MGKTVRGLFNETLHILQSIFYKFFLSITKFYTFYLRFSTFSRKNGAPNSEFSSYFYLGLIRIEIAQYLKLKHLPPIFVFRKKVLLGSKFSWKKTTVEISITWDSLNQRKKQNKTKQNRKNFLQDCFWVLLLLFNVGILLRKTLFKSQSLLFIIRAWKKTK